jgi:hypothetical protein
VKVITGIIPCKDRFFLDAALRILQPSIEELVSRTNGEQTYFGVATELYAGTLQLSMIYLDNQNTPPDKEQATVMHKMLAGGDTDYVGFCIFQFWVNSFHVFATYLLPQYRNQGVLGQISAAVESQAHLIGAPYISVAATSAEDEGMMTHLGYSKTYTMFRKKL